MERLSLGITKIGRKEEGHRFTRIYTEKKEKTVSLAKHGENAEPLFRQD
jgi:hypothetical protein